MLNTRPQIPCYESYHPIGTEAAMLHLLKGSREVSEEVSDQWEPRVSDANLISTISAHIVGRVVVAVVDLDVVVGAVGLVFHLESDEPKSDAFAFRSLYHPIAVFLLIVVEIAELGMRIDMF